MSKYRNVLENTRMMFCYMAFIAGAVIGTQLLNARENLKPESPVLNFADSVTLDNNLVTLKVSPSVGRVVWFGFSGQRNLIWLDSPAIYDNPFVSQNTGQKYYNIGGDKVWVSPQDMWIHATGNRCWPPDPYLDGMPWSLIEHSKRRIVMQSPVSPYYEVRITRTFTLSLNEPVVTIQNTVTRREAHPLPVMVWTVTQIKPPMRIILDQAADRPAFASDYRKLVAKEPELLETLVRRIGGKYGAIELNLNHFQGRETKIGTMGRWIAAIYPGMVFIQSAPMDANGAYPEVSSLQAFCGMQNSYSEMELLSPLHHPGASQTIQHQVVWELIHTNGVQQGLELLMTKDAAM